MKLWNNICMIKKYLIDKNSTFHRSLALPLFEPGNFSFVIDGLMDNDRHNIFPISNKIKVSKGCVDINTVPSSIKVVYLDELNVIKALVIEDNKKNYYLFKADHQKSNQLNINRKYINKNLSSLLIDYERSCKKKGKSYYDGVGDFNDIKDIDYFENLYQEEIDNKVDKKSNCFRLTFNNNNMFTSDFVELVENHKIKIVNENKVVKQAFSFSSLEKNRTDRQDCLIIDSESEDIRYLIFTYKPHLIKHYLLLENLGDNNFKFVKETICFNEIFKLEGIKDITFKNASILATRSFAKMHYESFYNEYISFELEEAFDEEIQSELVEQIIDVKSSFRNELIKESLALIKQFNMFLDIGITLHGKERVLERIGEMNDEEMLSIVKVAYDKGLTSGHYIEKDPLMFKFLSYQQSKYIGKTLRIYKDVLFFYSLEPPHSLITCFPYKTNYEKYISNKKK